MPTGYTADVQDGTVTDLRTFALRCARAFGALIDMRDEHLDAPIPDVLPAHTSYYETSLANAKTDLAKLSAMDEAAIAAAAEAYNAERLAYFNENRQKTADQKARYEAMLAKVEAWTGGPTELKEFMIEQLRESIRFDTSGYPGSDVPPETLTADQWFTAESERIARDIAYAEKNIAEEQERTAARNKWLADLRASLPEAG